MLKNSFRFLVPGAFGTLAALLLLNGTQVGMILGEASPPQQGGLSPETRTTIELERAPTREIKDPYPGFSAVAVDVANDEIILHDENNAQIMVYSRLDDTPDRATLTEPKRIIGGAGYQYPDELWRLCGPVFRGHLFGERRHRGLDGRVDP